MHLFVFLHVQGKIKVHLWEGKKGQAFKELSVSKKLSE